MTSVTNMLTIEQLFDDWTEPDVGEYYLACLLGLMVFEKDLDGVFWTQRGVFNTRNKISTMLFRMLEAMVEGSVLEKNDEYQYRWNKQFKGYWDGGKDGL